MKKNKPPVRIARNDPGLAHALSSAEIKKLKLGSGKVFARLSNSMSTSEISRLLRGHFGALLLGEHIARAHGTRAQAYWILLDAVANDSQYPDDLAAVMVKKSKVGVQDVSLPVQLSSHVVARFFQRTLGHGDLRGVALLEQHVRVAIESVAAHTLKIGDDMATATSEGALLWRTLSWHRIAHPVRLRAMTWIAADTAVDPVLKEMMQAAGTTQVVFRVIPASDPLSAPT